MSWLDTFIEVIAPKTWERVVDLVTAPAVNPEMIWIVIPLVLVTLLVTFYFGKHRTEELGWNTAFGNTLALLFVTVDLFRQIYHFSDPGDLNNFITYNVQSLLAAAVGVEALLLTYANYLHFLPKKLAFFISSALPVNLTAYVVITVVYSDVAVDWYTLFGALVLFVILLGLLVFLQFLQRKAHERVEEIEEKEEKELEEMERKEAEKERKEKEKKEQNKDPDSLGSRVERGMKKVFGKDGAKKKPAKKP